jgi:hypothetical protein
MFVNQQNFSPFLNIFIIAKFDELLHFGVYVVQIIGNIQHNLDHRPRNKHNNSQTYAHQRKS